jgi:NhaP-type Na+/H+ or K+/H+ antiporter
VDLAYTIILASVLLHDLVAPRLLRSLLVDAGAIRREGIHDPSPAAGAS